MNIIRLVSFFTIFGLLFFSTTGKSIFHSKRSISFLVVYSVEDKTDGDAEIDDIDDANTRSDDSIVTTNDAEVRERGEENE